MASSRGLGVTPQDMDASRLVFVSVKDAKPKRKVAVPIGDGASWDQFCSQVQTKLKLMGIEAIYLASSGEQITRLDQLQDIDELVVVEGSAARGGQASAAGPASGGANGYMQSQGSGYVGRVGVADAEITPAMNSQLDADTDHAQKYAKRQGSLQRTMKRVFPSLFQNSLPVTTKDLGGSSGTALSPAVEAVRRRIRRRRRSCADPRNLLILFTLISCLGTVLFVYTRTAQALP